MVYSRRNAISCSTYVWRKEFLYNSNNNNNDNNDNVDGKTSQTIFIQNYVYYLTPFMKTFVALNYQDIIIIIIRRKNYYNTRRLWRSLSRNVRTHKFCQIWCRFSSTPSERPLSYQALSLSLSLSLFLFLCVQSAHGILGTYERRCQRPRYT